MVTKKKSTQKRRVKVGKLKLKKETVKDLSRGEGTKVKGGKEGGSAWCDIIGPPGRQA